MSATFDCNPGFAAHRPADAEAFLGLKWIRPDASAADQIVARRGDHFVQVNHDATGFFVAGPNGMSKIYRDVDDALECLRQKVP